jgi:hypothetical protein
LNSKRCILVFSIHLFTQLSFSLVPQLYPGLGCWVAKQREEYKKCLRGETSRLNNEKIAKLSFVGFVFATAPRKRRSAGTATNIPVATASKSQRTSLPKQQPQRAQERDAASGSDTEEEDNSRQARASQQPRASQSPESRFPPWERYKTGGHRV